MAKGGLGAFRSTGSSDLPELPGLAGGFKVVINAVPNVESFTDANKRFKGIGDAAAGAAGGQMLYGDAFEKSAAKLGLFNVTQDAAINKTDKSFNAFNKLNRNVKKATVGFADLNKYVQSFGLVKSVAGGIFLSEALNGVVSSFGRVIEKVSLVNREFYFLNKTLQGPGAASIWSMMVGGQFAGLSPETTLNAVASVGGTIRGNPGVAAWVSKLLGRDMTGTNAISGKTPLDIVNALHNKNMPFWAAQQYGTEVAGIPGNEFTRLWDNLKDVNAATEEQAKRIRSFGVDVEKSDSSFVELHRSLIRVGAIFELLGTQVGGWLARNIATPALNELAFMLNPSMGKPGENPQYPTTQAFRNKTPGLTAPWPKTAPSAPTMGTSNLKESAISYYQNLGISRNAAIGIVTGMQGESGAGLDPNSTNPTSGMYGVMNWDKNRRSNFQRIFGHDIHGSSREEQMQFAAMEMQGTGGDPGTAKAFQLLKSQPNISASQATTIWEDMAERHGNASYTAKLASQAQSYAMQSPSKSATQNFDIDHAGVTVNVQGNMDYGTLNSMNSILNNDFHKLEMSMRQAIRSDTFR